MTAPTLVAYPLGAAPPPIEPAPRRRAWLDQYPRNGGYRCGPMNLANQLGWQLRCPVRVEAEWAGGVTAADLQVTCARETFATSHFGNGLLTFHPGYLFRTAAGIDLLVSGPRNAPKAGATALEGLVETDWLAFPFTMNWRLTPRVRVTFEAGEPFCTIVPFPSGWLERFQPELRTLADDPALAVELGLWTQRRAAARMALDAGAAPDDATVPHGDYLAGRTPIGARFAEHQTKLVLQPFRPVALPTPAL